MSSPVPNARSLFAAAREDGPDAGERDAMFRGIALATGVAAGAAAAAIALAVVPSSTAVGGAAMAAETATSVGGGAAATGTAFGMKLLALGAVLGAVSTALGVILAVTVVMPDAPRVAVRAPATVVTTAPGEISMGAKLAQPAARKRDPNGAPAVANAKVANANANADANAGASDLGEEARLVTAARNALVAGDPARALSLVQATRKLSARSLEPEELGLEARALHALGRADEAAATELVLRRRYPDHALAR